MQRHPSGKDPEWSILKLLNWTTSFFNSHKIENARAAAEILLADVLKLERIDLYLRFDQPLNSAELAAFKALIKRRLRREPVAYIVGHKGFWNLDLEVSPAVLIPRPDTERLVEAVLEILPPAVEPASRKVLEIGTGSGAIVLALASERPRDVFWASDSSPAALAIARKNANRAGLESAVHFLAGDLFAPLDPGRLTADVIVSNPPYIPSGDIPGLEPEVSRHEPRTALDGGPDGLVIVRRLIEDAFDFLVPGGHLLLEIGHDQKNILEKGGREMDKYISRFFLKDYGGVFRVLKLVK